MKNIVWTIFSIFQTTSKYIAEILLESASEKRIFLGISDFSWKVAKSLAHQNEIHDFLITSFIWKYAGNGLNIFARLFIVVYLKISRETHFSRNFFFFFVNCKGLLIDSRSQTYRFPSCRNWPWPRGRCNLAFSLGAAARTLLSRWSFNRVTAPSNRARWRRTMKNMWETPIMETKGRKAHPPFRIFFERKL